ncbi:hypothetical protein [Clostridium frigidicarnis]|uniref:Uncharacterized protein n=1 Tax=Clostridium frigidicarnis TaxID=84698 RepID=A0A1I0XJ50_9CLOT|nr:hypothetical protein [Clostridium frigidicarnis]SFA99983.1 hypothetical protein SAMN04488528_100893 [Clostridium frigidicarnis]
MANESVVKVIYKNQNDIQPIASLITEVLHDKIKTPSKDVLTLVNDNRIEFVTEDDPSIKGLLFKDENVSYYFIGGMNKSFLKLTKSKLPDFVNTFHSGYHLTHIVNTILKEVIELETTSYYVIERNLSLSSINLNYLEIMYPNISTITVSNIDEEIANLSKTLEHKGFEPSKKDFSKKFACNNKEDILNINEDEIKIFVDNFTPKTILNFILKEELKLVNADIEELSVKKASLKKRIIL